MRLLSIAKLQNLKAIHNTGCNFKSIHHVVINRKTTKFESNSQLPLYPSWTRACCYQSQNYKIWKQFTTGLSLWNINAMLLSIAKLQNLKAIHNKSWQRNSHQLVVINRKTTKFESNSQRVLNLLPISNGCYQSQNYKIWKQFTTTAICPVLPWVVVINRKTTKFESNSQQG